MKEKEDVNCVICKNDNSDQIFEKNSFRIVKCRGCGLVYVNPRLKFEVLEEMYNDNEISSIDYYLQNRKNDEKTFDIRLKAIEKHIKPGKLLDVGSGIGVLLNQAKKRGWDPYGIDIKRDSISFAKQQFCVNANVSTLEDAGFENNFFDAIVMNDLIEHVSNPINTLKIANKLLKSDGLIFLSTPNIESLMAKVFGAHWLHLKPNEHIYYFSPSTMSLVLEKAGFKMLYCRSFGRVRSLDTIFSKIQTYCPWPYKLISKLKINNILSKMTLYVDPRDEIGFFAKKIG